MTDEARKAQDIEKIKQALAAGNVKWEIPKGASLPDLTQPASDDDFKSPVFNHLTLTSGPGWIRLRWGAENIGFGEITLAQKVYDGEWYIDTEGMGNGFVTAAFAEFLGGCTGK